MKVRARGSRGGVGFEPITEKGSYHSASMTSQPSAEYTRGTYW